MKVEEDIPEQCDLRRMSEHLRIMKSRPDTGFMKQLCCDIDGDIIAEFTEEIMLPLTFTT